MREWLQEAVSKNTLSPYLEGFLLGRGFPQDLIYETKVGQWELPQVVSPDSGFHKYGTRGDFLKGWTCFPVWAPRGRIAGAEFRKPHEKKVMKYYLPDSPWVPLFGGMVPSSLEKIAKGGDVWIVEGFFDLCLTKVVPERDAVLAMGGAKMTKKQHNFFSRFVHRNATVHVCFDMDETGRNQSRGFTHPETNKRVWGVVERLQKGGLNARLIEYRGGKDPGEVWENGGKSALREQFT